MRGEIDVERGRSAAKTINSVAELATEVHRILLRHERKNAVSIKRARLAKTIGVSASSLYAYLNGTTLPPADTFDRLLDALDVSTEVRHWLATARDELTVAGRGSERRSVADVWPAARWQLPMDITEFTGRAEELHYLGALADSAGGTGTATTVAVIQGMPGVGKTRLAVRAAHQIAASGRFDDIQLWVDLRGFDPDRAPADPADVLALFLRTLGVADEQVPPDPDARAALYRDRLHGRKALVLLDNAASEAQVRPLLPGSPTCMVLVTSRCGLPGIDGAHPVRLEVLSSAEAVDLLARIVGRGRVTAEPAVAVAIAELCGGLPIAITLLARLLQARPAWTQAHLAERLADADQRLARLAVGDRDITGAFSLSYRFLRADLRQLFRLLSLHPGDDFTPAAAAALVNVATQTAERWLDELLD